MTETRVVLGKEETMKKRNNMTGNLHINVVFRRVLLTMVAVENSKYYMS
jgi:hypothetical protein